MTRTALGPVGVTLDVRGRSTFLDDARALETMGYATIWVSGGQLDTLDPLPRIIRATDTIGVGSAIIPADVYDAATVAATYAEIEATHPGRFVVGVGGGHGPRPLATTIAYLDGLEATNPPVPASATVLAALGPRKLELARDRTGGAIPILVTPEYTASARAVLGPEAALIIGQLVVLDRDPAVARETARGPLRFLSGIGGYPQNFRRMGFSQSEVADLGDRLVDGLVAWGGVEDVATRVAEHLDAGADQVDLTVLPTRGEQVTLETWSGLADRLIA